VVQLYRPFRDNDDVGGDRYQRRGQLQILSGRLVDQELSGHAPESLTVTEVIFNPLYFRQGRRAHVWESLPLLFLRAGTGATLPAGPRFDPFGRQLNGYTNVVRLLDIPDFAKLNPSYSSFKHNDWILLPETNSPPEYRWP